jgi:hypothetical protein
MDEKKVLRTFSRLKVITIEKLVELMQCSVITVRRRLKTWNTFTSINRNGRYYTLPQIPVFDDDGLWRYQSILFSKHGNLKQTILGLIRKSQMGLSAGEIAQIVDLSSSSSFFTQIHRVAGIRREKHQGRFVYFSDSPEHYRRQMQERTLSRAGAIDWPTDAQAVLILVELIKHPGIAIEQLSAKVAHQGQPVEPGIIEAFLASHDLLKKTSDTKQ